MLFLVAREIPKSVYKFRQYNTRKRATTKKTNNERDAALVYGCVRTFSDARRTFIIEHIHRVLNTNFHYMQIKMFPKYHAIINTSHYYACVHFHIGFFGFSTESSGCTIFTRLGNSFRAV